MEEIINRLNEIDVWIRENGFSNRGVPNASPRQCAETIKEALETLLNAKDSLKRWERFYMNLFIEKALKENPSIAKYYPEKVRKYEGGWMSFDELDRFYRTILNEIA